MLMAVILLPSRGGLVLQYQNARAVHDQTEHGNNDRLVERYGHRDNEPFDAFESHDRSKAGQ